MKPNEKTKIVGAVAPGRKIDAIYYQDDGIFRQPVILIVVKKIIEDDEEYEELVPQVLYADGFDDAKCSNFLGYEIDGKEEDWIEEIKRYKQHEAERVAK